MTSTRPATPAARGFAERLKTARKHLGLTQEELALKAGLSTITLSKLESGVNRPSFDVIVVLSRCMNIEPNYFFGWSGDISPGSNSDRRMRLQNLMLHAEKLDDRWIAQLIEIATLASK